MAFGGSVPSNGPFFGAVFTGLLDVSSTGSGSASAFPFSGLVSSTIASGRVTVIKVPGLTTSVTTPGIPSIIGSTFPVLGPIFVPRVVVSNLSSVVSGGPVIATSINMPLAP